MSKSLLISLDKSLEMRMIEFVVRMRLGKFLIGKYVAIGSLTELYVCQRRISWWVGLLNEWPRLGF